MLLLCFAIRGKNFILVGKAGQFFEVINTPPQKTISMIETRSDLFYVN